MATTNTIMPAPVMTKASPLTVRAWHMILSQPDGRDKVLRLVQYVCKLLRGVLEVQSGNYATVSATATAIEATLASARQAWRLFKWTSIYTKHQNRFSSPHSSIALSSSPTLFRSLFLNVQNDVGHMLSLIADIGMFFYFVFDNLTFAAKTRLLPVEMKKMSKRAAQWWTIGTTAAAVSSLLNAYTQRRRQQRALLMSSQLSETAIATSKLAVGNCDRGEHGGHQNEGVDNEVDKVARREEEHEEDICEEEIRLQREQQQAEFRNEALDAVRQQRVALVLALRHAADAVIAATNGYDLPVHSGAVGACGTFSSTIGLALAWPSKN